MFKEISIANCYTPKRSLVYGVGLNDSWYKTSYHDNGLKRKCEIYTTWSDMLRRCYSDKFLAKWPNYNGATVCNDWLIFSKFYKWTKSQNWKGMALDKDIIKPNNKHYSPENCAYVTQRENNALLHQPSKSSKLPRGVTWDKVNKKYKAKIFIDGKERFLGRFDDVANAEKSYLLEKAGYLKCLAEYCANNRVSKGFYRHAKIMTDRAASLEIR